MTDEKDKALQQLEREKAEISTACRNWMDRHNALVRRISNMQAAHRAELRDKDDAIESYQVTAAAARRRGYDRVVLGFAVGAMVASAVMLVAYYFAH